MRERKLTTARWMLYPVTSYFPINMAAILARRMQTHKILSEIKFWKFRSKASKTKTASMVVT